MSEPRCQYLDEGTVGRVPLVLGPGLVGGLPADQAGGARETHGHVVPGLVRVVVEPRMRHLLRQRPSAQREGAGGPVSDTDGNVDRNI